MIAKIKDYYGVIVFYFLLILLLMAMSFQNQVIDMQEPNNTNIKIDK